jgi:heme/copper-type cytochrome/quinol oxidase subunit 2
MLITVTLLVLLNIETLAIFKVLNPKASKWFVIIPRTWMIFVTAVCFVFASWNYHLLGQGNSTMDPLARLLRLIHGLSVIISIQVLVIYWLILVRTTLKKKPNGEIGVLLRAAQLYVAAICLICLIGNSVYIYFETIPYDDPRKVEWIMWPSLFVGAAVLPMFRLFLTMIQIKMTESKWKVHTPNAVAVATQHFPVVPPPTLASEPPKTLMKD